MGTMTPASAKPRDTAKSTRSWLMSAMMMALALSALLTAAASNPTAPAPRTKMVEPWGRAARSRACIATESGSASAPASRETFSGSLSRPLAIVCLFMRELLGVLLVTPFRRVINALLKCPLEVRKGLCRTAKPHAPADIVATMVTKLARLAGQTDFQGNTITRCEICDG